MSRVPRFRWTGTQLGMLRFVPIFVFLLFSDLSFAADEAPKPPTKPPAVAKDTSVQPTFTGDKAVIALPAPIDELVLGGNGRFVIGHLKGQRKLIVVDTFDAKVAKMIPLPPGPIAFAAGRDKLMIAEKDAGMITRWNLKTFEKELSVASSVEGPIKAIAMGSDAIGPVVISGEKKSGLMNPNSMKVELFSWNPPADQMRPANLAASADGHVVVGYNDPAGGPAVVMTVTLDNILDRRQSQNIRSAINLIPSADGTSFFETSIKPVKIWRADLTKAAILEFALANATPSLDPAFFIAWEGSKDVKAKAAIYSIADRRPLATIDSIDELSEPSELPPSSRFFYSAKSNLLITVGGGDDKLIVRKFDLIKTLDAKETDYLFITSSPPTSVMKGKPLNYAIAVKSKRGGVKYSLEEGPKGMTITPAGLLRWQAPPAAKEIDALVTVKVTDAADQPIFQEFVVSLIDAPKKPTQTAAGKGQKGDNRGFTDRALGPIDKLRQNQKD